MVVLGFDEVWIDEVGNVTGLLRGSGDGPRVQFNAHMDHVDPGEESSWPYPPYGAEIYDGAIYGRGACDLKGQLACQVHALGALKAAGIEHKADLYMAAVVWEERGGLGARHLGQVLPTDYAVIGEPTRNQLMLGHRGRCELDLRFRGHSAHAGMPQLAINPHYSVARFLTALRDLPMVEDAALGPATVSPTLIGTDQLSANVIPGEIALTLDWRSVPADESPSIVDRVRQLLDDTLLDGCKAHISLPEARGKTWTGRECTWPLTFPALALDVGDPLTLAARSALQTLFRRDVSLGYWRFATDGGRLALTSVPCIGFAPGDERLVHTVREHIRIEDMVQGMAGNMALALALGALPPRISRKSN
jgi:putative selenium metabolism hydrolase